MRVRFPIVSAHVLRHHHSCRNDRFYAYAFLPAGTIFVSSRNHYFLIMMLQDKIKDLQERMARFFDLSSFLIPQTEPELPVV